MSDPNQMNAVINEVERLRAKLTAVDEALHEVVVNLQRHTRPGDTDRVRDIREELGTVDSSNPLGGYGRTSDWVPGPGDAEIPPEEVEILSSWSDRESWTQQFGYDVYERGLELYDVLETIKDSVSISWRDLGKLLASAPIYAKDDAPEPYAPLTLAAIKYAPYLRQRRNGEWTWQYAVVDSARRQACLDAARYWAGRLNISLDDEE